MTVTRKTAITRLKRVEDGLLHVQATLPAYLREVKDVRQLLEGPKPDRKDSTDAPPDK